MPQQVEVPGHGIVEFPDSMTDAQIAAAIKKNTMLGKAPPDATETPGFLQNMARVFTSPQLAGGPMARIGREGVEQVSRGIERGAYEAGGAVTDLAAGAMSPEVAGGLGYATNVAAQAIPSILMGEGAKVVAAKPMQAAGRSLMSSAVKPTIKDIRTGKAAKAIDTLLEEGINPTQGGVEVLKTRIADLNDEISKVVSQSPEMINKAAVGQRLQDALTKFQKQVNPQSDIEAIRKAWLGFRNHPLLAGKTSLPVPLAQELKQGTYKQLSKKYGEMGSADVEAQKALARGLKEEISKAVPSIEKMNAKESELINALSVAERRALMDLNKNPMGLSLLANNPYTWAAFLADKSAAFKSIMARMLYSGSNVIPATAARAATAPLLMQSGQAPILADAP